LGIILLRRVLTSFAVIAVAGLALAGCSSSPLLDKDTYSQMFTKKVDLFATPEWAQADTSGNNIHLTPTGPVPPEDLVTADGRCAPPVAATSEPQQTAQAEQQSTQAATPPADRPVGSMAGDLASAPMPAASQSAATTGSAPPPDRLVPEGRSTMRAPTMSAPPVLGGIALGMTECQVVRRAGAPSNVAIGGTAKGQRSVVLSYLGGEWPGIYHFQSGRLKVIEAAPEQAKPATAKRTRKAKKKSVQRKAPGHEAERYYVQ
jgi:hypothetical protein